MKRSNAMHLISKKIIIKSTYHKESNNCWQIRHVPLSHREKHSNIEYIYTLVFRGILIRAGNLLTEKYTSMVNRVDFYELGIRKRNRLENLIYRYISKLIYEQQLCTFVLEVVVSRVNCMN